VCDDCGKHFNIPGFVETTSTLIYVIAGFCAFGVFFMQLMSSRNNTLINGPSPVTLLILLLVFYAAVGTAKVFWAPLKALSDRQVQKSRSTWDRFAMTAAIIVVAALLLEKCGS